MKTEGRKHFLRERKETKRGRGERTNFLTDSVENQKKRGSV